MPSWRLALMFDAADGDVARLETGLRAISGQLQEAAGDAGLRLGIADRHPSLVFFNDLSDSPQRSVDGAIEVSIAAGRAAALPDIAKSIAAILDAQIHPAALEVMAGPFFPMVPVRDGGVFLSLAFKRFPGTTSEQFQRWWFDQHSNVAIPILGEGLLAYDQVHLDAAVTQAVAIAAGVAPWAYDAYDNLTWSDRDAFLHSISDIEGMTRIYADEVGRIDDNSRRHALMRKITSIPAAPRLKDLS